MPSWFVPKVIRGVVQEIKVTERVDELSQTFHRFQEAYEGLEWLLARDCENLLKFSQIKTVKGKRHYLYRQAGDPIARTPDIVVLFTYDDNQVNLIGIDAKELDPAAD